MCWKLNTRGMTPPFLVVDYEVTVPVTKLHTTSRPRNELTLLSVQPCMYRAAGPALLGKQPKTRPQPRRKITALTITHTYTVFFVIKRLIETLF
jgi:hypothetical protein